MSRRAARLREVAPAMPLERSKPRAASMDRLRRRLDAWATTGDDWLWEATSQGRFTYSSSAVNYCGYTADETLELSFEDVLHPEDHDRLRQLIALGQGWRSEVWHCIAKDGSDIYLRGSAIADLADDGSVRAYIGTAQVLHEADEFEQVRRRQLAQISTLLAEERLNIVFQPIVGVDSSELVGAEALSRFPQHTAAPDVMFRQAAEVGLGTALELLAIRRALVEAERLPVDIYVSINVSPATILSSPLEQTLLSSYIDPTRLVIEVTEHQSIADYALVSAALRSLREEGVRVAVDDAGAGFASFRHILELQPDFIKLDRSLIHGIDTDLAKRAVAGAVVMLALDLGAAVVAEGVETVEEFQTASVLGIDAAQGFLLGRPTDDWTSWSDWHALRSSTTVTPTTLRIIQELSLAGASPATIAAKLNAMGERSPRGSRWSGASVSQQLAPGMRR